MDPFQLSRYTLLSSSYKLLRVVIMCTVILRHALNIFPSSVQCKAPLAISRAAGLEESTFV